MAAIRTLIARLRKSPQERDRVDAAYELGKSLGSGQAAQALLTTLQNRLESPSIRAMAAEQLAYHCADRKTLLKAYLEGLGDPEPQVRFWCVYGLACIKAKSARRRLQTLAATDHAECPHWQKVSTEAKWALAMIDDLALQDRLGPGPFHKPAQLPNPSRTAFLRRAIELAAANVRENTGGPFGAVIVRGKEIVAEGANRVVLFNDPTAHAEIIAIREACRILQTFDLTGCEIYCSCEPNPMCLGAIYWARLAGIHYAASREDAARAGFNDLHLYAEVVRPIAERSIPTRNLRRRQGRAPFEAWNKSAGKIRY